MKATDTRTALKNGTMLKFYNSDRGLITYTVQEEIGRGGSCIVYNACYTDNLCEQKPVRIKECYPFKLYISRNELGELIPCKDDILDFEKCKEKVREDFKLSSSLFKTKELTNFVPNAVDIYEANNTVYIVCAYAEGKVLSEWSNYTVKEAVQTVKGTAYVIQEIHNKGYLCLDIKPENIFVYEGAKGLVQLFDFDSLISVDCDDKENYIIS